MLTPTFRLDQDEEFVYFKIQAPYTNVRDTEVDISECNFIFSSEPYFLRLKLPGSIIEDDSATGKYDSGSGEFSFQFRKQNRGEDFPNLDMITSLMAFRGAPDLCKHLIEVNNSQDIILAEDEEISAPRSDGPSLINRYPYGFANKTCCDFDIGYEFPNIFELKTPNEVSIEERKQLRSIYENQKFSDDHYLADTYDAELIKPLLDFEIKLYDKYAEEDRFTDEQIFVLKELPNEEYLLTKEEQDSVLYGMCDVLFAYCYDRRVTLDDLSIESSWTINKLSATLSWFETFESAKETLISCYRRSLIYPIYRHFGLCEKVHADLVDLLRKGRVVIVKCLLDIYKAMNTSHDARYILNQLYMKDFLIFAQKCSGVALTDLAEALAAEVLTKSDLALELEELERAAEMVRGEERSGSDADRWMAAQMASVRLGSAGSDSSSSSSDSCDSCSSSSESSSELDSDDDDAEDRRPSS